MLKKTCLITGGGTRIGKEIALSLADKGYNIAIQYYKSKKEALITKEELLEKNVDAEIFYCNFKKQNSYQNLIQEIDQRFSNFEILINTSSLFQRKDIIETTTDDLKEIFEINFFAFYELLRTFCLSRNEGQIINLSDTKITQKSAAYGTYITSRLAAEKLIKIAASQFAPKFRINSIAIGFILPQPTEKADYINRLIKRAPLNKQGKIKNLIQTITFLLNNDYITGETLFLDGGENLIF